MNDFDIETSFWTRKKIFLIEFTFSSQVCGAGSKPILIDNMCTYFFELFTEALFDFFAWGFRNVWLFCILTYKKAN